MHVYSYFDISTYVCLYRYNIYIYIYILYVYVSMYVCMYVCMHVYIHKHLGSTMPAWRAGACALGTLGVGVVFWFVFWGATQQDTCDFEASFSCVRSGM